MRGFRELVLLAILVTAIVPGCGDSGTGAAGGRDGSCADEERVEQSQQVLPFSRLIAFWASRSDEERMHEILAFAVGQPINAGQKHSRRLVDFCKLLIDFGQLSLLLHIEDRFQWSKASDASERIWVMHAALYNAATYGHQHRDAVLAAVRALAPQRPRSLLLAPWREGGVLELLKVLRDDSCDVRARADSARSLGDHGTSDLVPDLVELQGIATPYHDGAPYSGGVPLGEAVTHAIKRIKARASQEPR